MGIVPSGSRPTPGSLRAVVPDPTEHLLGLTPYCYLHSNPLHPVLSVNPSLPTFHHPYTHLHTHTLTEQIFSWAGCSFPHPILGKQCSCCTDNCPPPPPPPYLHCSWSSLLSCPMAPSRDSVTGVVEPPAPVAGGRGAFDLPNGASHPASVGPLRANTSGGIHRSASALKPGISKRTSLRVSRITVLYLVPGSPEVPCCTTASSASIDIPHFVCNPAIVLTRSQHSNHSASS